ncbi:response regulator transcription factor [Tenacibaculum sp. M341]|uniref:response regulator transcription factor n=1 Tax=Tenacibaculum sp. M341 TaxID=2530339 RepID=UPI001046936B|nr:response regulator transcription factor [Tenacibaculum sp. M341]TCI84639.1 response regulator transcription factor [Tenacibaculum sp. M341]
MKKEHYKVLLAEDDFDFGNILKQYLEMSGYIIKWAKDGEEALKKFKEDSFHICVFDVMMPKMDGFTLAEKVVEINPEMPFVFLTARKLKEDKLKGLKLGADDYIVKPFDADELVLRLNNIIRRTAKSAVPKLNEEIIKIGVYVFNARRLELIYNENIQKLTEKEASLILFLYQHKNQMLKREEILNAVWKNEDYFSGRSMDVFISRLRKYFKRDASIAIESSRGIGLEFKLR